MLAWQAEPGGDQEGAELVAVQGGGSNFQPNRAVVQKTCRRLCHVHAPLPSASRQPTVR